MTSGVGYIRIKDFTSTTVRELDEAIEKLEQQGMQKLVLDLRQNPGGLLDAAVGVADHFLEKGQMIVYTKGRTADSAQEYVAPGKHERIDLPLVVLVNRGSASASEIFAGAIQVTIAEVVGRALQVTGSERLHLQYGTAGPHHSKGSPPRRPKIQRDFSSFYDYYSPMTMSRPRRFRSLSASSSRPTQVASSTVAVGSLPMFW